MSKLWKVFKYEYTRHVFRKRFIFAVLSIPLFFGVLMAISILATVIQADTRPLGYVDQSGVLANQRPISGEGSLINRSVELIPYPGEAEARAALEDETIQGYYLLPPDYLETAHGKLVSFKEPDQRMQNQFNEILRVNLLAGQSPDVAKRVLEGSSLVIQTPDGKRQMAEDDWFNALIPIFAGVLFMTVVFTSGGYLMQAVVEEKENRTMEIIVTSVSADELMAGKVLGNLSVGLTQLLIWVIFIILAMAIGRNYVDWIDRIHFSWDYLILMLGALLPTFVMIAGLMAAVGATVTESREAQQISGIFSLPVMIPYWFTYPIMSNPSGPLAVGLSFFPLTSPVTLTLRAAFTPIPAWQLALNIAVLVVCAIGSIWLAARAFRLGMLSYGKKITLRELFGRVS